MNPISNPFSPGAGSPPPELVGRDLLTFVASSTTTNLVDQPFTTPKAFYRVREE
jgi:hypothetical protein